MGRDIRVRVMQEADLDKIPEEDLARDVWDLIGEKLFQQGLHYKYDGLSRPTAMFMRVMTLDRNFCDGGWNNFFFQWADEDLTKFEEAVNEVLGEPHIGVYREALQIFLPRKAHYEKLWRSTKDPRELNTLIVQSYQELAFGTLNLDWNRQWEAFQLNTTAFVKANKQLFVKELEILR